MEKLTRWESGSAILQTQTGGLNGRLSHWTNLDNPEETLKSSFIVPTMSAIIAGLVLAAAGFFFFTPAKEDPLNGIIVEYRTLDVSQLLLTEAIKMSTKGQDIDRTALVKQFATTIGYNRTFSLLNYKVRNTSGKVFENVSVSLGPHTIAYLRNDDTDNAIEADKKSVSFTLLPDKTAELLLAVDYASWTPSERFLVHGLAIPITHIEPKFSVDPVMLDMHKEYPILFPLAALIGLLAVGGFIVAFSVFLYGRSRPQFLASAIETETLARDLALVNWIRSENPERYSNVVKQAEGLFDKWRNVSKAGEQ